MPKKTLDHLWVRLGDCSEYEEFGVDFDALASLLAEFRIGPDDITFFRPFDPKKHVGHYLPSMGFTTPSFAGNNYVSLFWSDESGEQRAEPLSSEDQKAVVAALRKAVNDSTKNWRSNV